MLEKSGLYLLELLKIIDDLQRYEMDFPLLVSLKNVKVLLLKQQAIHRLLVKAVTTEKGAMNSKSKNMCNAQKAFEMEISNMMSAEEEEYPRSKLLVQSEVTLKAEEDPISMLLVEDEVAEKAETSQLFHEEKNLIGLTDVENKLKADIDTENEGTVSRKKRKAKLPQENVLEKTKDMENAVENGDKPSSGHKRKKKVKERKNKVDSSVVYGKCRFCQERLTLNDSSDHIQRVHPEKKSEYYNCPICGKMAMSVSTHVEKFHNPDRIECDVCKKPFKHKERMAIHRKVTHFPDDTDFLCSGENGCGKRFTTKGRLQSHLKSGHNFKYYVCHLCGMGYNKKSDHQRHLINVHGLGEKKHTCPQCEKIFAVASNLRAHLRTHMLERNYRCTICQKSFYSNKHLKQHEKCHKPPQHKCMICGKLFIYLHAGLGTHLKQVHGVNLQGNVLSTV